MRSTEPTPKHAIPYIDMAQGRERKLEEAYVSLFG